MKYSCKEKLNVPINHKKYSCYALKENSYKEFDNEKNSCRTKIPHPPHNFSNGPSLRSTHDFFNNRVIKYWNQLPLRVRNSTINIAFKAGLDLFKLSKPDLPNGFWKLSEEIFNRISVKVNMLIL